MFDMPHYRGDIERNKAEYLASDAPRMRLRESVPDGPEDGRTYGRTEGQTDGRMDGRTY